MDSTKLLATTLLLDKIDRLASGHPLTRDSVSHSLAMILQAAEERSDDYVRIYTGGSDVAQMIDSVELRVPGPASDQSTQLLALALNDRAYRVSMAMLIGRYGEGEMVVPTPHQPPDSPLYIAYPKPWGRLSFGFGRAAAQCLCKVVIKVQRAPSP